MKRKLFSEQTLSRLKESLKEDIGAGDLTTDLLVSPSKKARAIIIAKEKGVLCGLPVVEYLAACVDGQLKVQGNIKEGHLFLKNTTVVTITGSAASILKVERTALNLLAHLSAISTQTKAFVDKIKKYPVFILDTRKTTPLWRELEKYAVKIGGGRNHRKGLYDAVLVKENHRAFGDLKKLKHWKKPFEMEARNLKELREALKLGANIIMLDNFSPSDVQEAVGIVRKTKPETILEASGGMHLENVAHYAALGVDWISVGALTHSVKAIDFSLLIRR